MITTEIVLASIGRRAWGAFIDSLVVSFFVLILFYDPLMSLAALAGNATTPETQETFLLSFQAFERQTLPYIFALYLLYHTILVWQNGMTIGKYFAKIHVVPADGDKSMTLGMAFVRALGRTFGEMFLFYITFLPAFFTPLRQTLHDRFAKTIVVKREITS